MIGDYQVITHSWPAIYVTDCKIDQPYFDCLNIDLFSQFINNFKYLLRKGFKYSQEVACFKIGQ